MKNKKNLIIICACAVLLVAATLCIILIPDWGTKKFEVTFVVNGGSEIASQSIDDGGAVTKPADPTKANSIFKGWFTDEALTSSFNFETDKITADTKLYAKWADAVTVTYNTDGGNAIAASVIEKGTKVTKPADPTKANCIFKGWYKEEALTNLYDFNANVDANTTIYAKWADAVTVTYNTDGGNTIAASVIEKGTKVTKPADPTKAGFIFDGWYADADFEDEFDFDAAITANVTVYAKWAEAVTMSFDSDGGTEVASITVKKGTVVEAPEDPTKEGFEFAGWWYMGEDEELVQYDFETELDANITLIAKWTPETEEGDPQ